MFHVKQKRVAFRSLAGGVSGWSPAAPAFSLPFCPHPPRPPSPAGKGEIFGFLMQGAPPLAFPGLNPGGTGSIGRAGAPGTPATEAARHWLAGRLRPLHPWGLSPGGTGSIGGAGAPAPLLLNPRGAGLPGGSAPCIPGLNPGSTDIPSGRNHLNITGSTLANAYL